MNPTQIKYNNTSVNWSKYSKPWDVIFDYPGFGYCQIFVKDLPSELPKERSASAKLYRFQAQHKPLEDNYSHSEIVTFKEDAELSGSFELPSTVKKEFKTIISDRTLILVAPK